MPFGALPHQRESGNTAPGHGEEAASLELTETHRTPAVSDRHPHRQRGDLGEHDDTVDTRELGERAPLLDDPEKGSSSMANHSSRPAGNQQPAGASSVPTYGLSAFTHLLWGLHPVLGRFLQVTSPTPMNGLVLTCSGQVLSGALLWLSESVKAWMAPPPRPGVRREGSNSQPSAAATALPWWQSSKGRCLAALFGGLTTLRVATNILSLRYTAAYNTQLVQSLSPMVVALAEGALLRTRLPCSLWPALAAMLAGMALVALGQSPITQHSGSSTSNARQLSGSDALGVGLQLVSVLFSACSRLCMVLTKPFISSSHLVQIQNASNGMLLLAATLAYNPKEWLVFLRMSASTWAAFAALTVLVFWLGKVYQVAVVRLIGPSIHASIQPLRVLVAVAGSSWLLSEPVSNLWEWAGIAVTCVALSSWLLHLIVLDRSKGSSSG